MMKDNQSNKEVHPLVKACERYRRSRKCVGSRAAVIILFWYFAISFASVLLFLKHTIITTLLSHHSVAYISIITLGYLTLLQCLSPVSGYLSDTKLGRYRTIQISLGILLLALICLVTAGALTFFELSEEKSSTGVFYTSWLFFFFGMPGIYVNALQFGLDQLFQTPAEDQSLFIQWYVWMYYLANIVIYALVDLNYRLGNSYFFAILTAPFIVTILIVLGTLYLSFRKRNWFFIITKYKNPYSLVYSVTRFSFQKHTPLQKSTLTYCSEDITSKLDLAKEKYRGPYTSEQVEDVKAFYGVLKVIFSLGPALFTHVAEIQVSQLFATHFKSTLFHSTDLNADITAFYSTNNSNYIKPVIANGTINSCTSFIIIPLFIFLLRPFVRDYVPGMLKRIGIGMCLSLFSVIILFVVDILIHVENENSGCIFAMQLTQNLTLTSNETQYNTYPAAILLVTQQVLTAVAHVIFYVALYQFICSQSPHSMKGFLLGMFFATRGVFQLLGALLILPFAMNKYSIKTPSCVSVYFMLTAVIGVGGLVVYSYMAKRYKLRVREDVHSAKPPVCRTNYLVL